MKKLLNKLKKEKRKKKEETKEDGEGRGRESSIAVEKIMTDQFICFF